MSQLRARHNPHSVLSSRPQHSREGKSISTEASTKLSGDFFAINLDASIGAKDYAHRSATIINHGQQAEHGGRVDQSEAV